MSLLDLVCNECGLHTTVAEQGKAGFEFRCRGCGKILEVPESKGKAQSAGETDEERLYRLGYEQGSPTAPTKPYNTGWGRVVRNPEGSFVHIPTEELQGEMRGQSITAEEALRRRGLPAAERELLRKRQYKGTEHVYTTQGGIGVRPPDRPGDPKPSKEDPHSES